ncbi:MAG: hypothetical protein ACRYGP_06650 [Janthinobacterium lividum]
MTILDVFQKIQGYMYGVRVLVSGDTSDEPRRSKLVLFEDEVPLRLSHEQHSSIAGTGRGSYSHWESNLLFSSSDNSDPNTNGRTYSYSIDHAGRHKGDDTAAMLLSSPFHSHGGLCWGIVIPEKGDDRFAPLSSALMLLEDGQPIGPAHTPHADIERNGGGAYSHWENYLYFSTSDGSDPNTNGCLYSYEIDD